MIINPYENHCYLADIASSGPVAPNLWSFLTGWFCCELTLTHGIILRRHPYWQTCTLSGAQLYNRNIDSDVCPVDLLTCLNNSVGTGGKLVKIIPGALGRLLGGQYS